MVKPTMDDVARRAGVSRALVSLVMHESEKVSDRSRIAVLEAADALGYRPNLSARHLASKRTRTFGLLINDLHNPYFPSVADGIKRSADSHGYRLLLNSAFLNERDERAALEGFVDHNVDGVILTGTKVPPSFIEQIADAVPVVVVSRPMRSKRVDTINNDDRLGARLVVDHLVELGHRDICHLDGGRGAGGSQRRAGYEAAMRAHGLEPHVVPAAFTEAAGARAAANALSGGRRVTAIFAGNDLSAVGALDVIDDAGLAVPGDISLVGYDNTFVAALRHIDLTTVDQGRECLGELAVRALLERIEEGRTVATHQVTPPTLVARGTTAPPPG
ncbi:MAG: LacI family DNA-binding transcriptional regulator [Ilumatobacter sp.]|uniref:LacI family DNA-binding transcriptional regulator n=1 Tax=Ilumatobacter sp. TaxID=1967498 RepID=UPI0026345239|nr:LacI family DNA-binding transcriptional regulator [Ilumatobacter sp.]MDJ0770201.1 LacI family DNA-binding transcriptional regulator [Ilumatobacter sp.]